MWYAWLENIAIFEAGTLSGPASFCFMLGLEGSAGSEGGALRGPDRPCT